MISNNSNLSPTTNITSGNSSSTTTVNNIVNIISIPKIILVTYRLKENNLFQPAEEILLHYVVEKLGLTYERIEYDGTEVNNFFGKMPVVYFNGKIIVNKKIVHFLKDIILLQKINFNTNSNNATTNTCMNLLSEFDNHIENLIYVLKDQLSFSNEYYYYLKLKEKYQKLKTKKMLSSLKTFLFTKNDYENVNNNIINSFSCVNNLNQMYMNVDNKIDYLIKDSFHKLHSLINREFSDKNLNLFTKLLIYSFLSEDKNLFIKIKRPVIEHLKSEEDTIFSNIGVFYKNVEEGIVNNKEVKFVNNIFDKNLLTSNNVNSLNSEVILKEILQVVKKYSISFNPKVKNEDLQQYQARSSFYHQVFSIGIFCGFAVLLFYITTRRK